MCFEYYWPNKIPRNETRESKDFKPKINLLNLRRSLYLFILYYYIRLNSLHERVNVLEELIKTIFIGLVLFFCTEPLTRDCLCYLSLPNISTKCNFCINK